MWRPQTVGARAGFSPGSSIFNATDEELGREMRGMAEVGVRWVRLDLDWSSIEQQKGRFDWCNADRVIGAARAVGLDVIALPTYTPTWARPRGTPDKHPPEHVADYARFVGASVGRYRPMGVRVFELWNEPNISAFWSPRPDVERYASLFRAGAAAARARAGDIVVLSGGLAPARDAPDGQSIAPATFLRMAIRAGVDADGYAVHPYTFPRPPAPDDGPTPLLEALAADHTAMGGSAHGERPLWLTEVGAPTGSTRASVTEAEQSAAVTQVLRVLRQKHAIRALLWYSYRDAGRDDHNIEANFGLVRRDFSPKRALAVFRAMAASPDP